MRERNKLEITIVIDDLIHNKIMKYLRSKNIKHATAFDEFVNRAIESKINFIQIQKDNWIRQQKQKEHFKQERKEKHKAELKILKNRSAIA